MKRTIIVAILIFLFVPVFAGNVSAQFNLGYGIIDGTRYETTEENAHNIKASGIEAGTVVTYMLEDSKQGFGAEAYFDYLFALKGSWDKTKAPRPTAIPSDMKYTDYKAGIGVQYRMPLADKYTLKMSGGFNFAGVSNHTYSAEPKKISNQISGQKVTSFGLYLDTGIMYDVKENLALSLGMHSCFNTFGFIRNFDAEKHSWVNFFNTPSRTKCLTSFLQIGLMVL